jgi:aryl-alcohol dehydrogenase-like predicted oxidoreductase
VKEERHDMVTRSLAGVETSVVGLGTWALGGDGWTANWGPQDVRESVATIHRAVERDVRWLDTAAVYGLGHAERVIGDALARLPAGERPMVFTKCGRRQAPDGRLYSDLRPATIRSDLEASLRRLGAERLAGLQIHNVDDSTGTPLAASWEEMARLRSEGLVQRIGLCNGSIAQLADLETIAHIDTCQLELSLVHRARALDLLPWCAERGIAVIARSTLGSGLLTDAFTPDRLARLSATDWRRGYAAFRQPEVGRSLALRQALRALPGSGSRALEVLAVAWVLAWPGVSGAVVGARTPSQVDRWAPGADLDMGVDLLEAVADAIRASGAGVGPEMPARSSMRIESP